MDSDARRRLRQGRRSARAARLHVGAPGQATAVHGPGVRPDRASGPRSAASTGTSSTRNHCTTASALVADLNATYRATRHCGHWTPRRGLLLDRRQRHREQRAELSAVRLRRFGHRVYFQLLRRRARQLSGGTAARGTGGRSSTPTRPNYAARASATSARSRPTRSRGTAGPRRRGWRCRQLGDLARRRPSDDSPRAVISTGRWQFAPRRDHVWLGGIEQLEQRQPGAHLRSLVAGGPRTNAISRSKASSTSR